MQKISNIALLSVGLIGTAFPLAAAPVSDRTIAGAQLQSCFEQTERLARLKCYDELLDRPQIATDVTKEQEVPPPPRVAELPRAIEYANSFLLGETMVQETVSVTLRAVGDGANTLPEGALEQGLLSYLRAPFSEENLKDLRSNYDLFLALASDESIGEPATLLLSCENNISRLKLVFSEPFEGRFAEARFYGSERLTQDAGLSRKMWVRSDGFLLENARGLDAIKLMGRVVAGARSQIGVGTGDAVRSAFFETKALREALPLLAQHCSWSSGLEN